MILTGWFASCRLLFAHDDSVDPKSLMILPKIIDDNDDLRYC